MTFLRHNPQQEIFEAMKFKQLHPHPLETMLPQVEQHFDVERIVLTPNETYVTLELMKESTDKHWNAAHYLDRLGKGRNLAG